MKKPSELNVIRSICQSTSEPKGMSQILIKALFSVNENDIYLTAGSRVERNEIKRNKILGLIWKDINRNFIFNSKSRENFKLWLEWLKKLDDSQVKLLSDQDKAVRKELKNLNLNLIFK